jgi:hypothetical protein
MPNDPGAAPSSSTGSAGSRVTLACRGFGPSEPVDVSFGATALTTAKATAGGQVSAFLVVPSGFAGSPLPGEKGHLPGRPSGSRRSLGWRWSGIRITRAAGLAAAASMPRRSRPRRAASSTIPVPSGDPLVVDREYR